MATNPRIDDLRKRLEKEPGSRLFAQLAEELRKDGELEEAIRVARDGLQKHPAYPSARMTLGRALLDTGDWASARAEFEIVLKSAADNILASRYLAECLENLGERDAAIARYKATLAMAPGEKHVLARLAELEGGGGGARVAAPAVPPMRPAAGLRPSSVRPATGAFARPPAPSAPPPPPAAPPPPIPLATVEGEMELETARSAPASPGAAPEAPANAFAPIPLVDADEEFELERPYESPTTGIGLGTAPTRPAPPPAPPAPSLPAAAPPAPAPPAPAPPAAAAPAEDQEFELEAPHEAPSVGWAATIRPLPVVEEPPPPPVAPPTPPPTPRPAAPPPRAEPLVPSTLTSPTLGELYFNQGFTDKAIEVYRDLAAREPENARLGARLRELEKIQRSLSGPDAAPAGATPAPFTPPLATPPPFTPPPAAPPPVAPPPAAPPFAAQTQRMVEPEPFAPRPDLPATIALRSDAVPTPPADAAAERRQAIERTIERLEGLLAAIRKG